MSTDTEEQRITSNKKATVITRQASLQSLTWIHNQLERCGEVIREVQELGNKMKRTPVLKPAGGGVGELPPLSIETGRSESEQLSSSVRTRSQGKKPPASPIMREIIPLQEERSESGKVGSKIRGIITEEDVVDIPNLTKEELVQEIPQGRQWMEGSKEILQSWTMLAEEIGVTRKEIERIVENAKVVVDIRISTYAIQLFKVVVSAILRQGGWGSLQTNRQKVNQEIQRAIGLGELRDDQVDGGTKKEDGGKMKRVASMDEDEKKGKKEEGSGRMRDKEEKKARRLRTQLGGLYSSDSEKGESSETTSSDSSIGGKAEGLRSHRKRRKSSSSTSRSTSSEISPRREKQRRDKEYLQAVRATRPGKYNGDTQKPQALVSWITQMTQYFSLMNLSRRDEVRIAISYLEEEAATWWTQVPKHRKKQIKSWKSFKEYVVREFLPHDYNLALWRKLDATYQRTSVAEYVARFHEIQRQLFDLPRKVAKTKLLNGLKPNIRGHVLALRPRTQREVIRLARNFDEAYFAKTTPIMDRNQWYKGEGSQQRGKIFSMRGGVGEEQGEVNLMTDKRGQQSQKDNRKFQTGKGDKKQFKCFNCGKPGHMARECWAPRKPFSRASVNNSEQQEKKGEEEIAKDLKVKPL